MEMACPCYAPQEAHAMSFRAKCMKQGVHCPHTDMAHIMMLHSRLSDAAVNLGVHRHRNMVFKCLSERGSSPEPLEKHEYDLGLRIKHVEGEAICHIHNVFSHPSRRPEERCGPLAMLVWQTEQRLWNFDRPAEGQRKDGTWFEKTQPRKMRQA